MKASVLTKYGSPDYIQLQEIEKPIPKENEVLVKVVAASINSWDWELLIAKPFFNRQMAGLFKPTKIKILGCDIAGRIEAVGNKVTQYQPGDEVFGDLSGDGWAGFAEYVCAPENALTLKPTSITFEEAAALPQAGLLALQSLRDSGHIQEGQKVLINGAGGGSGSFAIQMAKLFGAEVTGVDSAEKLALMRSLGADHVIDYQQEDFTKNGQHYDLIVDLMARHSIFDYKRALSPSGIYVMTGGSSSLVLQLLFLGPLISFTSGKKMGLMLHKANKGLDDLIKLIESGKVKAVIDKRYALSEVAEALSYFANGHTKGKLVITIKQDSEL